MPRYIVKNEQVLNEFMSRFWKALGRKKGNAFAKIFANDPIVQKHMRAAQKHGDEIQRLIAKKDEKFWQDYRKKHGDDIFDD
jgi:hypothetical protein|tara:strand:+ start:1142 stop:1387 length:246 start_codon:yes stop_codon:yes gene_type:complete